MRKSYISEFTQNQKGSTEFQYNQTIEHESTLSTAAPIKIPETVNSMLEETPKTELAKATPVSAEKTLLETNTERVKERISGLVNLPRTKCELEKFVIESLKQELSFCHIQLQQTEALQLPPQQHLVGKRPAIPKYLYVTKDQKLLERSSNEDAVPRYTTGSTQKVFQDAIDWKPDPRYPNKGPQWGLLNPEQYAKFKKAAEKKRYIVGAEKLEEKSGDQIKKEIAEAKRKKLQMQKERTERG
jgi:hypothetical protein